MKDTTFSNENSLERNKNGNLRKNEWLILSIAYEVTDGNL
jgi:hypothetical protein